MADERGEKEPKPGKSKDETSELTAGDLEALEGGSTELDLGEIEELEDAPPPTPGLGKPRKPPPRSPTSTI